MNRCRRRRANMTNKELIDEAISVIHHVQLDDSEMGSVGCALLTDKGHVFYGVCIDTSSGMGFCAEHTAISQMITQKEYSIARIVAVYKDKHGNYYILPPCGRCREFMYQINKSNIENTTIILGRDNSVKLKELLPYYDYCSLL